MAKFIRLTTLDRNNESLILNIDTIEYMQPIPGSNGTALVSTTHHTKYRVQESMDDILQLLSVNGLTVDPPLKHMMDMSDILQCNYSHSTNEEDLA